MSNQPQKLTERPIEQEVSYLLDKQEDLLKTLSHYNGHVANFEDMRDNFLQKLLNKNEVNTLKEVTPLFDRVAYVELDVPDFVVVDVPDRFKNAVDINKEYYVVDEKDIKVTKKLSPETIQRILQASNLTSREDIFRSLISGRKEHTVFSKTDEHIILNGKQFQQINNNGKPESIVDYSDEIFQLIKNYCIKPETIDDIGMKPLVNENTQTIICYWA